MVRLLRGLTFGGGGRSPAHPAFPGVPARSAPGAPPISSGRGAPRAARWGPILAAPPTGAAAEDGEAPTPRGVSGRFLLAGSSLALALQGGRRQREFPPRYGSRMEQSTRCASPMTTRKPRRPWTSRSRSHAWPPGSWAPRTPRAPRSTGSAGTRTPARHAACPRIAPVDPPAHARLPLGATPSRHLLPLERAVAGATRPLLAMARSSMEGGRSGVRFPSPGSRARWTPGGIYQGREARSASPTGTPAGRPAIAAPPATRAGRGWCYTPATRYGRSSRRRPGG